MAPRSRLSLIVAAGCALTLLVILMSADPVRALSCATHPNASPEAIVAGTAELATAEPFFDTYDIAIVGQVVQARTTETPGSNYGQTQTTFSVAAAFGVDAVDEAVVVSSSDPGWLSGYPFEVGRNYFVPLQQRGPDGQHNYSFVCDPITQLGSGREVESLVASAHETDLAVGQPGDTEVGASTSLSRPENGSAAEASPSDSDSDWLTRLVLVTVGAAGVVFVAWLARRVSRARIRSDT